MKGAWEPDTVHDVTSPWMTTHPDAQPGGAHTVYLNGFGSAGGPVSTSANPNLATVASSFHAAPFVPLALFGIWKDCNQDGYVGLGDEGALEYRAELLLDDTVCPPASPLPGYAWTAHNVGGWVIEYMPIGYDDVRTPEDENPFNLNVTTARVWADWGLPGDAPRLACPTTPAPHGSFRSTGGMLRYVDCFVGYRGAQAVTQVATAAGQPGLGFGDAPPDRPDRSASPLNMPNPWGSESDPGYVTAFDCSERTEVAASDPTDPGDGSGALHTLGSVPLPDGSTLYLNLTDGHGRFFNTTLAEPEPATPSGGTPAGTVNETEAALDCDRTDADEVVDVDGHHDGSDGDLPYALEGPAEPVSPYAPRTRTDHVLAFEEGLRGTGLASLAFGSAARDDAGLGAVAVTGFWVGPAADALAGNPLVSRADLGFAPVTLITYYAYVDLAVIDAVPLVMPADLGWATYGVEGCDRSPPTLECDPDAWWLDTTGADVTPRDARLGSVQGSSTTPEATQATKIGVRVGQPYMMRDVDCVDTTLGPARAGGVHWGRLTGTQCPRP